MPKLHTLELTINGRPQTAPDVRPHTTLLNWLRDQGLTGCKEGCAEGECGACAVLVARPDEHGGTRLESVNACLVLMGSLAGQEVVTAEGLGRPGVLHPVQHELAVRGGSQCGYCTPGFVVSMAAEYYRPERAAGDAHHGPNGFDIHALSGNLCRCTGYRPIQDAAYALAPPAEADALAQRRTQAPPMPQPTHLSSPDGDFHRPATLAEAVALLAAHPDAKVLAGGTDWGVEVNLRHARAGVTIAVDRLPELRTLTGTDHYVELGAGLNLSELERRLGDQIPLLREWFPHFASRLIRNSATLGGNLGTASPIGDSPPVLLALDAGVVVVGPDGEREVPLADYFTGYRQTVRLPGELIRAVRIPLPLAPIAGFFKIAKRRFDDISSVAVGIALELEGQTVRRVRIGLGGVAATPIRGLKAEAALTGQIWNEQNVRQAAKLLGTEGTPLDDHRASAAYRAAMLEQTLLKFYFERTAQRQEVPV
ncbi:xanthine dehydrogenase small subunit [Deinococcus sp. QL22]|uniref:xanthine dehydrogenase small subunit n=1 Tax=Deinococcus sp. QL22 TaxID=2939437 RepID=UPI002017BDFA|nr:FAD binding domain-containing protein [Deinococcus sp. QL22]UQN09854.1 FAD binding domain-containing protein [Deinococcus sp. QL22]